MLSQWLCSLLLFRLVTEYALKVCLCFICRPKAIMDDGIFFVHHLPPIPWSPIPRIDELRNMMSRFMLFMAFEILYLCI